MTKQKVHIITADTIEELAEYEAAAKAEGYETVSDTVPIRAVGENNLGIKGYVKFMSKQAA